MRPIVIIPARYGSTRYPGKPLATLKTREGEKTLIELTWQVSQKLRHVVDVYVATDDARIADEVARFGGAVVLTSSDCRNGTERCADALEKLGRPSDLIVNLQGDAPLTPPWFVDQLIDAMMVKPNDQVATPVLRTDETAYRNFVNDRRAGRVGGTTAVFNKNRNALYFSKEVLPYGEPEDFDAEARPVYHHVGLYAYRKPALERYVAYEPSPLEEREGLEQLRFLENNIAVRCVEMDARGRVFWELNNPEDVARIEKVLQSTE